MNEFRFKKFTVRNEQSPMKVGTDGVLLGACVSVSESDSRILDIGTGTGVIALMLAQRSDELRSGISGLHIEGIDIDAVATNEAASNFASSQWANALSAINCGLANFRPESGYDLVVSNPPFFDNSLGNNEHRRNEARHCVTLSYREIIEFCTKHLNPDGRLAMILPSDERLRVERELRSFGLYPFKVTNIRTTASKKTSRFIVESALNRPESIEEQTITLMENGQFTTEYKALTHDFYLYS